MYAGAIEDLDGYGTAVREAYLEHRAGAAGAGSTEAIGKRVAMSPDEHPIIVSTNVGSERWAITCVMEGSAAMTLAGNVLTPTDAVLLWCDPVNIRNWSPGQDVRNALIDYVCSSAAGPLDWVFLSDVTVPGSFLLP